MENANSDQKSSEKKEYPIPYTIRLKYPVEWGKDEDPRDTLIVKRRLKGKDLKEIPSDNIKLGHMVKLVSKITGEPMSFVDELDSEDLFKAIEVVKSFLPNSQTTGEDS